MRLKTMAWVGAVALLTSCGHTPTDVAALSPERQAARFDLLSVPTECACTRVQGVGEVTAIQGLPNTQPPDISLDFGYLANGGTSVSINILFNGSTVTGLTVTSTSFDAGVLIIAGNSDSGAYQLIYNTNTDTFTLMLGLTTYLGTGTSTVDNECLLPV